MSQENVTRLRRFLEGWDPKSDLEGWKRGEYSFDPAFLDPELEYEDTVLPDHVGEVYRGYEGVARATERWLEPFESLAVVLERIVGNGDRLVSIHRWRAKAQHTGIELEGSLSYVWTFTEGRVTHFKSYWEAADALEAARLSE